MFRNAVRLHGLPPPTAQTAQRRTQEVSESSSNSCQELRAGEHVHQLQVDPRMKLFMLKVFFFVISVFVFF